MLCMSNELIAAMASSNPNLAAMASNPNFAAVLAQQQQNILATSGSLTTMQQQQPISANSTSPLQQNMSQQQLQQMIPVALKNMSNPASINSSAPNSQKPSFSLTHISEVEMMKLVQQQQSQVGVGNQQPQAQKIQTQFLLSNATFGGDKNGKETNFPGAQTSHPNSLNVGNQSSITPNQHPMSSPASSTAPQQQQPNNQLQQNANPHLKRSHPIQPQQTGQPNMPPFNIMNYQEQLLASMNGPPPAKRHSISAVPPSNIQQPQPHHQTLTQHPMASLPMLYGVAALHPQLAAAAQAQQQQHLNGMAKTAQPSSVLSLPTIPPSFVATQARANGTAEQNQLNGLAAAGLNAQMLGLPEGINLNQLIFQAQQQQARLNGTAVQPGTNQQPQVPIATQAQHPQLQAQQPAVPNQNMMISAYQQQFLQLMQQQKNAMAAQALQNPQAQAFAAMQQSASPVQQHQIQIFLQQQQIQQSQQAAANAALAAEQQRRRSTISNPAQFSAAMSAATQQQQMNNANQQQQPTQQHNSVPLGAQLAALIAQRNSPMNPQQNGQDHLSRVANTAHSNNSPTTSQQADAQTAQPPRLQRISPPNAQNTGNEESNVQKLLAQMSSAFDPQHQNQQAIMQQIHNHHQQQLAQNHRLLQLQQQFADAQASTSSLPTQLNPAISTSNPQLTMSNLQQHQLAQPLAVTSYANQLIQQQQQQMANSLPSMNPQSNALINQQSALAHPMAQHHVLAYPQPTHPQQSMAQQSINNQILQNSMNMAAQLSASQNGNQNGTPRHQTPVNGTPNGQEHSPSNANKSSPFTPQQQQQSANNGSNRESTSTDPCLVIADDEENPVVD